MRYPGLSPVIETQIGKQNPKCAHYTEIILPVKKGVVKHNYTKYRAKTDIFIQYR